MEKRNNMKDHMNNVGREMEILERILKNAKDQKHCNRNGEYF